MLRDLTIRNFAIVEDVRLSFGDGFTAITGETGAGKSILIDALTLLAGGRASADMRRQGAEKMSVAARFDAGPAAEVLRDAGLAFEDEIVLRREMGADGRGRVFLDDEPVSARILAKIGEALVAIHGQNDEQSLLDPEKPLDLLEEFGGLADSAAVVATSAQRARAAAARRDELTASRRDRDRRLDLLRYEVEEIDAARLGGVDEEGLASERNRLLHADRIRQLGEAALAALSEGEGSAADRAGEAFRAFSELARIDTSFAQAQAESAMLKESIRELAGRARDAAGAADADPERLSALESRLEAISRLRRKYGATVAEILSYRERAQAERDTLDNLEEELARCGTEHARAAEEYTQAAAVLTRGRGEAAAGLSGAIERELAVLAMEKARFRIALSPRAETFSPRGAERAEILFAANPGEEERPLARVASGGELSRVQLAIESAAAQRRRRAPARTLVFDEVDAGIGGRVAEVVGKKLKALSRRDQVLCITHVPQIAALADRQLRVSKRVVAGRTHAVVDDLERQERVEEIARMLAGEKVTSTARDHARALLGAR
jgi:DNA repair protein RecN (Recombination protein N)